MTASNLLGIAKSLLSVATEEEAAELNALLVELQGEWVPLPGPQTDAYESPADELFYGGAAGGGKTDLGLGVASTQHWRSIIFRREGTQFTGPDGMIDRSHDLFGGEGKGNRFSTVERTWRMKDGRAIEFGAVEHESDWRKHQGHPHDLLVFDEVTQFTKLQYTMLRAWMRTTRPGQRTRSIATFNPPTTNEGEWVLEKIAPWIDPKHPNPAKPGELRWYAVLEDEQEVDGPEPLTYNGQEIQPWSRTFIPSRVEDNPYLMATGYVRNLDALPEPLRSQLRRGDMLAGQIDDPWQVIPTAWVRAAQDRWQQRSNPGGEQCAGVDVARGGKDQFVIAKRYGHWVDVLEVHPGADVPDGNTGAELILAAVGPGGAANVDVLNVGSSTVDFAIHAGLRIRPVNNAASAPSGARDKSGKLSFVNLRAYGYWKMRELLDPEREGLPIELPPDPELRADLCSATFQVTKQGIKIEAKDDIKKRLGRSPDKGDAVVLACVFDPAPPKLQQPADYGRRSFTTGRKLFLR